MPGWTEFDFLPASVFSAVGSSLSLPKSTEPLHHVSLYSCPVSLPLPTLGLQEQENSRQRRRGLGTVALTYVASLGHLFAAGVHRQAPLSWACFLFPLPPGLTSSPHLTGHSPFFIRLFSCVSFPNSVSLSFCPSIWCDRHIPDPEKSLVSYCF